MFFYYDEIEKETACRADQPVRVRGAFNTKGCPINEYEVTCPYGDIVLIIAMLRDYVKCLDEVLADDISYQAYYRNRFLKMAQRLQEQIGYDYDKALAKCRKRKEKEISSDVGEDAMVLAVKRGREAAKKTEEMEEASTE